MANALAYTVSMFHASLFILVINKLRLVYGIEYLKDGGAPRCVGFQLDTSRVRKLSSRGDLEDVVDVIQGENDDDRGYFTHSRQSVTVQGTGSCYVERERIQLTYNGIWVHGADAVLTYKECGKMLLTSNYYGRNRNNHYHRELQDFYNDEEIRDLSKIKDLLNKGELRGRELRQLPNPYNYIDDIRGSDISNINVVKGYAPTVTDEQAAFAASVHMRVPQENVGHMILKIFATPQADFLAYFGKVKTEDFSRTTMYDIAVDAHDMSLLFKCEESSSSGILRESSAHGAKQNRLRKNKIERSNFDDNSTDFEGLEKGYGQQKMIQRNLQQNRAGQERQGACNRCQDPTANANITWYPSTVPCPAQTLYLNNAVRTSTCVSGRRINPDSGSFDFVYTPAQDPNLGWGGVLDCHGTKQCRNATLTGCEDAISDVQVAAVKTLEVLRNRVGLYGGLHTDYPIPVRAKVHFGDDVCEAFFRSDENTMYFGDCDCNKANPFVSVDIVAHEIAHGVTYYTSGLEPRYQSAGLSEGFADVLGSVVEFDLNDDLDRPDFLVGESVGEDVALRNMENPTADGSSIGSVCDYTDSLSAHSASGPVNKAFVNAVRTCQASGCADEKTCARTLGALFMYTNVNLLTRLSDYEDAASAMCGITEEYMLTRRPSISCSIDNVRTFIKSGWSSVDIDLTEECQPYVTCDGKTQFEATSVDLFFDFLYEQFGGPLTVLIEFFERVVRAYT